MSSNYKKLGGWLGFFSLTLVLNVFLQAKDLIKILSDRAEYSSIGELTTIYNILAGVQLIIIFSFLSCIFVVLKKQLNSVAIIRATLIGIFVIPLLAHVAINIWINFFLKGILEPVDNSNLIVPAIQSLFYVLIWITYLKNSERAAVYFGEAEEGELKENPRTPYQKMVQERSIRKQEIIDALVAKNAISKESAVLPTELPIDIKSDEYKLALRHMVDAELTLRQTKGKYYLDMKAVKDPALSSFKRIAVMFMFMLLLFAAMTAIKILFSNT